MRILFYEGHGTVEACEQSSRQTCLYDVDGVRFPAADLATQTAAPAAVGGWGVLVLNSCDSGYVDLRGVPGPVSVLGSGFGKVPTAPFLKQLVEGLKDPETDLNCDGMITDRELHESINRRLRYVGVAGTDSNPIAVLRREADADVPLFWTHKPVSGRCSNLPSLEETIGDAYFSQLPTQLQRDLRRQAGLLRRKHVTLVESAGRYLFVSDQRPVCGTGVALAPDPIAAMLKLIMARGPALGIEVFGQLGPNNARMEPFVGSVARFAAFTRIYQLTFNASSVTIEDSEGRIFGALTGTFGRCQVESKSRDSANWDPVTKAGDVLKLLPQRMSLLSSDGLCMPTTGKGPCLAVRFDGRLPRESVRLTKWTDFLVHGRGAGRRAISLARARAIPCPSALGQCFELPGEGDLSMKLSEWLLLEDRVEADGANLKKGNVR